MPPRRTLDQLMLEDNFRVLGSRPSGRSVFSVGGTVPVGLGVSMLPGGGPSVFGVGSDPLFSRLSRLGGLGGAANILRGAGGGTPVTNPLAPASGGRSVPTTGTGTGTGAGEDLIDTASGIACGYIKNPTARALCIAAGQYLGGKVGGRGTTQSQDLVADCPQGYTRNRSGKCVTTGLGRYLPGDVGVPDTAWTPVAGLYGVGVTPLPVARTVRECPAGFVLGKDGVCYDHLARTARAHNPGARPLLTGGDMNALRRARQLEKKIGKISRTHGKKTCRCSVKPRGKK